METMKTNNEAFRISIDGMHCGACEKLVTMNLTGVDGVESVVAADATAGTATIMASGDVDTEAVAAAIRAAGFEPTGGSVTLEPVELPEPVADVVEACETGTCPVMPEDDVVEETISAEEPVVAATAPGAVAPDTAESVMAVGGMTCASCVAVVEKTVSKLPGVTGATVNLATERLTATYDPAVADVAAIAAAVKSAGYEPMPLEAAAPAGSGSVGKVTLAVMGMTCASCSAVVEKTLGKLAGVTTASVNLANETAAIEFDPTVVGVDDLIGAIKGAGYDAIVKV
ncbi:MAG: hypothetical protein CVU24_18370, partial [Betaproteobacteria bacterium HGW-Betaproteobacteria-18]